MTAAAGAAAAAMAVAAAVVAVATAAGAATNWNIDDAPARADTGGGTLFSRRAGCFSTQGARPPPAAGRRQPGGLGRHGEPQPAPPIRAVRGRPSPGTGRRLRPGGRRLVAAGGPI